jgi:hypothetical protein
LWCNNRRKDKKIKPIVLYSAINEDIKYKSNGFVIWEKESDIENPTIENLGLNDNTLKMIRRIWLFACTKEIDVLNLTKDERSNLVSNLILQVEKNEEDVLLKFEEDKQWELLRKYDYFSKNIEI